MPMTVEPAPYTVRLATTPEDLTAAQALRYRVFVQELGGDGPLVDHAAGLERDAFDPFFDHLVLVDRRIDPATRAHVIGAYRILPCDRRAAAGRFYSETET
jgi:putative hemolysin